MLAGALKIVLMTAVALVGVPHALCLGHPGAVVAVSDHGHGASGCEHCSGRSSQPPFHHAPADQCPHCDVGSQPYMPSAEVKLADTVQPPPDWALPSVSLVGGVVDAAVPAVSPELARCEHPPRSGCALSILLGRLLL